MRDTVADRAIVKTIDISNSDRNFAYLLPIGDIHWGHKSVDKDLLFEYLDWAERHPYCLVIGMGDLMETGVKTSYGLFDQEIFPEGQFEQITKAFKKLSDSGQLIGILDGNHERRIFNRTGFNVTRVLADYLDTEYLGLGKFIKIRVIYHQDCQEYTFYATHGSSGAWTLGGKINAGIRFTKGYRADCILHGHLHLLFAFPLTQYIINELDEVVTQNQHIVFTGSYLKHWETYPQQKGLPPTSLGSPRIELHTDMKKLVVKL